MKRWAAKVDSNQAEIVSALRAAGVAVHILGMPLDLLCWYRGAYSLLECKGKRGTLTPAQKKFRAEWPGPWYVVRSPIEALQAVGAMRTEESA